MGGYSMNKRMIPIIMFLTVFINLKFCYGKIYFSPGIKMGSNFTKIDWKESGFWIQKQTYPMGLNVGLFGETQFGKNISIVNEFYYMKNLTAHKMSVTTENVIKSKIHLNYLRLTCLFKWPAKFKNSPYLLFGPEIGHLLRGEDHYHDLTASDKGVFNLTNSFPDLEIFMKMGFGTEFHHIGSHFLAETTGLISLNEYKFISIRRNYIFQFILGIYLQ